MPIPLPSAAYFGFPLKVEERRRNKKRQRDKEQKETRPQLAHWNAVSLLRIHKECLLKYNCIMMEIGICQAL